MRYKRIVLATDGSERARLALDAAIAIAKSHRSELVVVSAYDNDPSLAPSEEAAGIAREAGVKASTASEHGPASDVIVELADRVEADLIVVGSRGLSRTQRMMLGSVSHRVAHHAGCDVLVVRGSCGPDGYRSLAIGTDGSATADRAARKGVEFAERAGARVTLIFVGHPRTGEIVLRDTHALLASEKVNCTTRILEGDPADKIIEWSEHDSIDLIVVGNKGMTGAARFLLGSVPAKVLQYASSDVLITRTMTQALDEIPRGEGGLVNIDGRKVAVYRNDAGEVFGLNPKCTHLGCTVGWNSGGKTWDCPCHGSRFAATGEVVEGPAARPLDKTDV